MVQVDQKRLPGVPFFVGMVQKSAHNLVIFL